MSSMALRVSLAAFVLSTSAHVGCARMRTEVPRPAAAVLAPPPPCVGDDLVSVPMHGYVWVAGHYDWDGSRWQWRLGYLLAARRGGYFVQPRYDGRAGAFVPGHWLVGAPPASARRGPAPPTGILAPVEEVLRCDEPPEGGGRSGRSPPPRGPQSGIVMRRTRSAFRR